MKYFAVSDVHSFYDELIEGLTMAGYDKDNESHTLIVCGDIFDRGPKTKEVYDFLIGIPKERLILIRGNHELLFLDLLESQLPERFNFSNGTVDAVCQLYAKDDDEYQRVYDRLYDAIYWGEYGTLKVNPDPDDGVDLTEKLKRLWKKITTKVKKSDVFTWLKSDVWKNYFELDRFIFVHCFIPLRNPFKTSIFGNFNYSDYLFYDNKWRETATQEEWYSAVWGCPWRMYKDGLFKNEEAQGKTLVCGHWHTSDFYYYLKGDPSDRHDIYYSSGIIALDGGVRRDYTGKFKYDSNVLVIEDGKCYNKLREELREVNTHD